MPPALQPVPFLCQSMDLHIHLFTLHSPTSFLLFWQHPSQTAASRSRGAGASSAHSSAASATTMWNRQPPTLTPAPCLHLLRRTDHLPRCAAALFFWLFSWSLSTHFSVLFLFTFLPLTLFFCVYVCVCVSYCSVTRSRSSLSLVYVSPVFFPSACRLSGLVLAHPVCVGSSAPQREFALLPCCSSFSADRSTDCVEGAYAPMGLNDASVPELHEWHTAVCTLSEILRH